MGQNWGKNLIFTPESPQKPPQNPPGHKWGGVGVCDSVAVQLLLIPGKRGHLVSGYFQKKQKKLTGRWLLEGIGRGQKRGCSVVCESACKSKGAVTSSRSAEFFFFENPWTPGGRAFPGSIISIIPWEPPGSTPKNFCLNPLQYPSKGKFTARPSSLKNTQQTLYYWNSSKIYAKRTVGSPPFMLNPRDVDVVKLEPS